MTLYRTLKEHVQQVAQRLALPLGWEGEVFTPPHAPHLRGKIVFTASSPATLGAGGLTRTDGYIELSIVAPAGESEKVAEITDTVQAAFSRGIGIDFTKGTATLGLSALGSLHSEGSRIFAAVTIPFWAFSLN